MAILALVAGIVAVAFIAWIVIVELANRYGDWRARKAEREKADDE